MIKTAFSIPFWQEQMPNFTPHRDAMIDAVYEFRDQFPEGEYKSNHAGYQSPKNLHHNQKFKSLFDFVNLGELIFYLIEYSLMLEALSTFSIEKLFVLLSRV